MRRKRERDVGSAMGERTEQKARERLINCVSRERRKKKGKKKGKHKPWKEKIVGRKEKEVDQIFLYLYLFYIIYYYLCLRFAESVSIYERSSKS